MFGANKEQISHRTPDCYISLLCACTAQNLSPLQAHNDNFGVPVTIGNAARSLGVELPELTMKEANKIAMATIYSTDDVFKAFKLQR